MDESAENFDNMTAQEFESRLPDLFATGDGRVSDDPRFSVFLERNPDCAALVRDLEIIADHAKSLFEPIHEPSDNVWDKIASKLGQPEEEEPLAN